MATPQFLKIQNTLSPSGEIFTIPLPAAEHSALLRQLIADFDGADLADATIPITLAVSDACLAQVFAWATHRQDAPKAADDNAITTGTNNSDSEDDDDGGDDDDRIRQFTPWDEQFFAAVDSQMLYEILLTANYLDMKPLYELACGVVINMIRGKTSEEICRILGVENDFTPEEEEAVRRETKWAYGKKE